MRHPYEGFTNARKAVSSGQELVELLRSVKDAESENAAISDVDAAYHEVIAEQKEVIAYETEHCETRGLKRHIDKLAADMASLQCGLEREGEWL